MKKYLLQNLDCVACAAKLESGLRKLDCVKSVSIDFSSLSMLIETDNMEKVTRAIARIEPEVRLAETGEVEESSFNPAKELIILGLLSVLFVGGMLFRSRLEATPFHSAEWLLFLTVYLCSGREVLLRAIRNTVQGKVFDENFLMTLATVGAIAIHALSEAAGVMLFFKAGEFLQDLSVRRSRRSIRSLLEIRPDHANLLVDGRVQTEDPEHVSVGSTVLVKPGERIPLDGRVLSGSTLVDTSALTGESVPRSITVQDTVLAGMVNKSGAILVQVTKRFGESSVSKILELVENAAHKKAKTELFFTTFAAYYTPGIVVLSLMTALLPPLVMADQRFSEWIYRALVILVISCPCALVVSIPLTYFGGIGVASRRGILIKGSNYLDALTGVKTVFLDKTGTITKGVFKVSGVVTQNGFSGDELLRLSAEAEAHSTHPIAVSIREAYGREVDASRLEDYQEIPGQGIIARIENRCVLAGNDRLLHENGIEHSVCAVSGTVVHIAVDGTWAGYLVVSDETKEDSARAVKLMKRAGVRDVIMLTGDSRSNAAPVAQSVGIDAFYADLLPEDKVGILERYLADGSRRGKIAFVGDGINDAPVLARSDVGISMGRLGSDAAIETADIVIMNDSLSKLPEAISIAKKNRRILVENITFALVVKSAFVVMGVFGAATMWEAVFGDMGVALIAILNATRMLKS